VSGTEQLLYLVVVPTVVVVVVWALAAAGGPRASKRYRPGRPYDFVPVWYVANHQQGQGGSATGQALEGRESPAELTAGANGPEAGSTLQGTTGGASDRW
jgi:hypothetical protein